MKIMVPMMMMIIMKNQHSKIQMWTLTLMFNLTIQHMDVCKVGYVLAGDLTSFWCTNLTFWIMTTIMIMKTNSLEFFYKTLTSITLILALAFYSWTFTLFYFVFEMSMVAILTMILSWGHQPERIEATMFMLVMTTMFSLPLFIAMMKNSSQMSFWFMETSETLSSYLSFLLIFSVKMPIYLIHMWLPKIHVESPIQGSMILAAVMLKLGCYGMIRMTKFMVKMNWKLMNALIGFAMWATLILALICNIQSDLKSLIAYSSVVHMMMTFMSIILMKSKSTFASVVIILGHGTCSSAMFFMCNQLYKISKSRSIILNKSMFSYAPSMATSWFLICMSNAPMPPSINVLGELLMLKALISWSWITSILAFVIMIFSFSYSVFMYCIPVHGSLNKMTHSVVNSNNKSTIIITMHIIPTVILIIKSTMMTNA